MEVDPLTVNLVNFEMGLFLVGILLGFWSFSMLMLPLLFGFSYCVYPVPQNSPCVSPDPN